MCWEGDGMNAIQKKIDTVFRGLQDLDIKATPHNVSIMDGAFEVLREIYAETGDKNERTEADPE